MKYVRVTAPTTMISVVTSGLSSSHPKSSFIGRSLCDSQILQHPNTCAPNAADHMLPPIRVPSASPQTASGRPSGAVAWSGFSPRETLRPVALARSPKSEAENCLRSAIQETLLGVLFNETGARDRHDYAPQRHAAHARGGAYGGATSSPRVGRSGARRHSRLRFPCLIFLI